MLMNKLLRTELFNLLIEKSKEEVNNNVMQNAYDEFIEKIRDISNENDYSTTYCNFGKLLLVPYIKDFGRITQF